MMTCDMQQLRLSGAKRMKLCRQRRREGLVGVIGVEVKKSEVDALVAQGLLSQADRDSRAAIAVGLERLLDMVLGQEEN